MATEAAHIDQVALERVRRAMLRGERGVLVTRLKNGRYRVEALAIVRLDGEEEGQRKEAC